MDRNRTYSEAGQCQGKARFKSPSLARRVEAKRRKGRHVYRCPHCGGWHLGNGHRERRHG